MNTNFTGNETGLGGHRQHGAGNGAGTAYPEPGMEDTTRHHGGNAQTTATMGPTGMMSGHHHSGDTMSSVDMLGGRSSTGTAGILGGHHGGGDGSTEYNTGTSSTTGIVPLDGHHVTTTGPGGLGPIAGLGTGMGPGTGTGTGMGVGSWTGTTVVAEGEQPPVAQRIVGGAEQLVGKVLGKPEMVARGEEKKNGIPAGAEQQGGVHGAGSNNTSSDGRY